MRGVEDGGAVRIGVVLLEVGGLISGERLGFEPMTLGSTGRDGFGLGNLEIFSASHAI